MSIHCTHCHQNANIKLSQEYIIYEGVKLYRIIANRYFKNIKKGEIGGYVQSLQNISGDAWITSNAKVFEEGRIMDNALIKDNAIIRGHATVSKRATVSEHALITDRAKIFGWASIYGQAIVLNYGQVSQDAKIGGNVKVEGLVFGDTHLDSQEFISCDSMLPALRVA